MQHKTWHHHRVKYPAEKNTKKSICDESAANGWLAAAPRPIIPFHPNHDADNSDDRDEDEEEEEDEDKRLRPWPILNIDSSTLLNIYCKSCFNMF